MTGGKTLSALQKALTWCINQHDGWATEDQLVDFLVENWAEITAICKQKFHQEPGLRLLHINTAIKKNGEYLFVRSPPNLVGINRKGEVEKSDDDVEEKYDEEEDSLGEEEEESMENVKPRIWNFPSNMNFQDIVIRIVSEFNGIAFDKLAEIMEEYKNAPGIFPHLDLRKRLRGCLIDARILKRMQQRRDGQWILAGKQLSVVTIV